MVSLVPTKSETIENRQCGMEGLGVAVIEQAVEDLERLNCHTTSAVYFFKKAPQLLEFWLTTATHQGRKELNLEVAKQRLYEKACLAEQNLLASHKKKLNAVQVSKQKKVHQR